MTTGGYQFCMQVCVDVKRFPIESAVFLLVCIATCQPRFSFLSFICSNSSYEVGIKLLWKQFIYSINAPRVLLLG